MSGIGDGTPLPKGYTVRPGSPSDLEAVHQLVTAVDIAVVGEPDTTLEDLRVEWNRSRFDVTRDVDLVLAPGGRVVGYLSVWEESPGIELAADIYALPELGPQVPVSRHLTERAVMRAQLAADTAQSRLALLAWAVADEPLTTDLAATGFEVRRRFWRMSIDLDDVEEVVPPAGIDVGPFDLERDLEDVHRVLTLAFSEHWGSHPEPLAEWRERNVDRADFDASLWRVARRGGEVVGAVIARAEDTDGVDCGWVQTVGVSKEARGHGIGEILLRSTFVGLADRGLPRAMLGVDSQNDTGATRLYERAGMHVAFEIEAWVRDVEPSGERTA